MMHSDRMTDMSNISDEVRCPIQVNARQFDLYQPVD